MNSIEFSRDLIKGKIAEIIFDQMFRSRDRFTIIPFGYESLVPELAQVWKKSAAKRAIETIKNSPDFVVIDKKTESVYLVEVKYQMVDQLDEKYVIKLAEKQIERWNPSWIFIATRRCFYFDHCSSIIKQKGKIKKFDWIDDRVQADFLSLLNKFENK